MPKTKKPEKRIKDPFTEPKGRLQKKDEFTLTLKRKTYKNSREYQTNLSEDIDEDALVHLTEYLLNKLFEKKGVNFHLHSTK